MVGFCWWKKILHQSLQVCQVPCSFSRVFCRVSYIPQWLAGFLPSTVGNVGSRQVVIFKRCRLEGMILVLGRYFVHPLHHLETKKRQINQRSKKLPAPMFTIYIYIWKLRKFPKQASQTATVNTSKNTSPSPTKNHAMPLHSCWQHLLCRDLFTDWCLPSAMPHWSTGICQWMTGPSREPQHMYIIYIISIYNIYRYIYMIISHRCATIYQNKSNTTNEIYRNICNKSNNVKCFLGLKTALF